MLSTSNYKIGNQRILREIPWIEWVAASLFFVGLFLILAKYAGGPLVSDDFYYMDAGLNGYKSQLVFFYYAHIYFQRIFMEIASSPLAGGKYYWAFSITVTAVAIYLGSRLLSKDSRSLNGVIAVALFLSLNFLSKYSGVTKNDFTAMMILALIFAVFILASRNHFRNQILIGIMGLLFFFASKSKETSLLIIYIFLGFGFDDLQKFSLRYLLKKLPYFFAGFVAGMIVFFLLNLWIVKEPLWGLQLADLFSYIGIRGQNMGFPPFKDNFLSGNLLKYMAVPFFLYLIFGVSQREDLFPKQSKILWSYPLVLVVFLTILLIFSSTFTVTDRFFFPAIPVMCIFASQVVTFDWITEKAEKIKLGFIILAGIILSISLLFIMVATSATTGYQWEEVTINMLQPVFLSIFMISFVWKKPQTIRSLIVPMVCLIVVVFQPLYLNFQSIVVDQPNNKRMAQLLYPLSAFSDKILNFDEAVFFISPNINKEYQMLSRNTDELRSMFNVYFRQRLPMDAFINLIINKPGQGTLIFPDPLESLPAMNYDYAFITADDWKRILQEPNFQKLLLQNYEIIFDDQNSIGLLSRKVK